MTGTAVAPVDRKAFRGQLNKYGGELAKVARRGISTEGMVALAVEAAMRTPQLLECTEVSVYRSMMRCARLGLTIGEDIYLVPVKDTRKEVLNCEAWLDYRGLKKCLRRAGIIRDMWEKVVYAKEEFEIEYGLEERLIHKPIKNGERGGIVGAYAIIQLPFGRKTFHYMSIEEIEAIRASSRQWGPSKVKACPAWYSMKTVVRDWCSRQPLSAELQEALAADDTTPDDGPERPDGVTKDGEILDADFEVGVAQEPEGADA